MTALPPSGGAVHVTVADPLPGTAETAVGAPGADAAGVTGNDAADSGPDPSAFAADTVKV